MEQGLKFLHEEIVKYIRQNKQRTLNFILMISQQNITNNTYA